MPRKKKTQAPVPGTRDQQQIKSLKEDVRILKVVTELQTKLIMRGFRHANNCDTQNGPLHIVSSFARGSTIAIRCTCGLSEEYKKLAFYQKNLAD